MTLRRRVIRLFDRRGGRRILGAAATYVARRRTGADITVFYDGRWVHRVAGEFFPDGRRFDYYLSLFSDWVGEGQKHLADAEDFWFQHYKPKPGDVVIDVGAGKGEDTLAFSRAVGPTGRVIALEAYPPVFEILADFCRRNDLSNTSPLPVAAMDKPGTVSMPETDQWFLAAVAQSRTPRAFTVRAATLSEICAEEGINEIAFVKMNIEGGERYALPGMEAIIDRVRAICVACHDFRAVRGDGEQFRTRAFVERFLLRHGFRLVSRPDDPRDYVRDHVFGLRLPSPSA